ncbi:hypothetical protein [Methanosarcina horonobensis]|uniref:hypothetical protein n=1 Tax=Methanosarcina horonobensis TaxID=418008 RepID=UPI000A994AC7|nr:hypothetical protein [Methanosarcina horonobensis]
MISTDLLLSDDCPQPEIDFKGTGKAVIWKRMFQTGILQDKLPDGFYLSADIRADLRKTNPYTMSYSPLRSLGTAGYLKNPTMKPRSQHTVPSYTRNLSEGVKQ